jgi:arrestin-related trafficking adapter 4/5/7
MLAHRLRYKVALPRTYHLFGTSIKADIELNPLCPGLALKSIDSDLCETNMLRTIQSDEQPQFLDVKKSIVRRQKLEPPNDEKDLQFQPDQVDSTEDAFKFSLRLDLPESLTRCRQSVSTPWILITHSLQLKIALDGLPDQSDNSVPSSRPIM